MTTVLYCCPSPSECSSNAAIPFQAIHHQQKNLLAYCKQQNFEIDAIYTDVVPNFSLEDRPALSYLLYDAKIHHYDTLICTSLDTLCSNHLLQSTLLEFFHTHEIQVICAPSTFFLP